MHHRLIEAPNRYPVQADDAVLAVKMETQKMLLRFDHEILEHLEYLLW